MFAFRRNARRTDAKAIVHPRVANGRPGTGRAVLASAAFTLLLSAAPTRVDADVQIRTAREPIFVDVDLGARGPTGVAFFSRQAAQDHILSRLRMAAVSNPDRLLTLRLEGDFGLRFADVDPGARRGIELAAGSGAAADSWYHARMAGIIGVAFTEARSLSGRRLELSVLGLPAEGDHGVNEAYGQLIDDLDAFVVAKSLILSGGGAGEAQSAQQALPGAFERANGRPVFFRSNQRWRIALGTASAGGAGAPPASLGNGEAALALSRETTDVGIAPAVDDIIALYGNQVDQELLLELLAAWGTDDSEWDLNGDGIVGVQDLLLLLSQFPSNGGDDEPVPDGEPAVGFDALPNPYVLGESGSLTLDVPDGLVPSGGDVVFQVWSDVTDSIEAPHPDDEPDFVYPEGVIAAATPGPGQIQAILRDAEQDVIMIVAEPVVFAEQNGDDGWDDEVDDDPNEGGGDQGGDDDPGDDQGGDDQGGGDQDGEDEPAGGGPAPSPVINSITGTSGMAPFAVHVDALNSTLGAGTELSAEYEWDFGDPDSPYNELRGWNVAHIYDEPGTYTIKLTIRNEAGVVAVSEATVEVTATSRRTIYVAGNGNDSNNGETEGSAVRTVERAAELMSDDVAVLFKRGTIYYVDEPWVVNKRNVLIGQYGSTGATPTITWNGGSNTTVPIIEMGSLSEDVVVQDLIFDTIFAVDREIPRGMRVDGKNITVRRCEFQDISDAMNSELGVTGWLAIDNSSDVTGRYHIWAAGTDIVLLGQEVNNSLSEHGIRSGDVERILIAKCDLTNLIKSCIWIQRGNHAWIYGNEIDDGSVNVGPNAAYDHTPFTTARIEDNHIERAFITTFSGAHDVRIYNNWLFDDKEPILVYGYLATWDRTCSNIIVDNNTIIFEGEQGRSVIAESGVDGLTVKRNLFCAPNLLTGHYQSSVVYIDTPADEIPDNYRVEDNVWPEPAQVQWGDGPYYIGAYVNQEAWDELAMTSGDALRVLGAADFDSTTPWWEPNFDTTAGARYRE